MHQYRMIEELKHFLISKQTDSNGKISVDSFDKALSSYFPQKQSIEIADLMSCAQSASECAGKDVVISCLFDHVDGVHSPFVQLLWRQGLYERTSLSRFLQVMCFQLSILFGFIFSAPGCCFQN